jgi:uncharacterized protein YhbP (UPF0306 family)
MPRARRNETRGEDFGGLARRLVDAGRYMTLATADGEGRPWASPVWYAPESPTTLLWVSIPDARHSRNIAARPEVAIVIFDSTVPVGEAEAVYFEATAAQVAESDLEQAIGAFSRRSQADGAGVWTAAEVTRPATIRLYRATLTAQYVLGPGDRRIAVPFEEPPARRR